MFRGGGVFLESNAGFKKRSHTMKPETSQTMKPEFSQIHVLGGEK